MQGPSNILIHFLADIRSHAPLIYAIEVKAITWQILYSFTNYGEDPAYYTGQPGRYLLVKGADTRYTGENI